MSDNWIDLGDVWLEFEIKDAIPNYSSSILPQIEFQVEVRRNIRNTASSWANGEIALKGLVPVLLLSIPGKKDLFVTQMIPEKPILVIYENTPKQSAIFKSTLDYYMLKKIEELRDNGDFYFKIELAMYVSTSSTSSNAYTVKSSFYIAKSLWVEKFLNTFQYKDVLLLEIPKIEETGHKEVSLHLTNAWKKFMIGDYPGTFVDCKKTLEQLKKELGQKNLLSKSNRIDFELFVESEKAAKALDGIMSKLDLFFHSGGRHIGSPRYKEEAELALLITHGIVNLIMKRMDYAILLSETENKEESGGVKNYE